MNEIDLWSWFPLSCNNEVWGCRILTNWTLQSPCPFGIFEAVETLLTKVSLSPPPEVLFFPDVPRMYSSGFPSTSLCFCSGF